MVGVEGIVVDTVGLGHIVGDRVVIVQVGIVRVGTRSVEAHTAEVLVAEVGNEVEGIEAVAGAVDV